MTKVLIADDAVSNRRILVALLTHAGYSTVSAENADEARRLYASEHPSHVITDMHMPGGSGAELARSLREMAAGRSVRIALVSGDDVKIPDGLFDTVLSKPVTMDELRKFLEGGAA